MKGALRRLRTVSKVEKRGCVAPLVSSSRLSQDVRAIFAEKEPDWIWYKTMNFNLIFRY